MEAGLKFQHPMLEFICIFITLAEIVGVPALAPVPLSILVDLAPLEDRMGAPYSHPFRAYSAPMLSNSHTHTVTARYLHALCPGKPADYMISDVVFKRFCAKDIFVVAPIGKRQKCSAIPEPIHETLCFARMLSQLKSSGKGLTHYRLCKLGAN